MGGYVPPILFLRTPIFLINTNLAACTAAVYCSTDFKDYKDYSSWDNAVE